MRSTRQALGHWGDVLGRSRKEPGCDGPRTVAPVPLSTAAGPRASWVFGLEHLAKLGGDTRNWEAGLASRQADQKTLGQISANAHVSIGDLQIEVGLGHLQSLRSPQAIRYFVLGLLELVTAWRSGHPPDGYRIPVDADVSYWAPKRIRWWLRVGEAAIGCVW